MEGKVMEGTVIGSKKMEKEFGSASATHGNTTLRRAQIESVINALEPDQLIAAKVQHHCSRRRLTRTEMVLFWALRIYLVFMVGVVVYQIWTGLR
jgi:hypothetical protein